MDTGTLPIVRPGFLKKWTFHFSPHPWEEGGGGQTWLKHPTPFPQQQPRNCKHQQGLAERSPERERSKGPGHGMDSQGSQGVLRRLSSTHGLSIPTGYPALGLS